jgi:dolichyl-phosphate beta-glucosyltransferase
MSLSAKSEPAATFILPVYNAAPFLAQSLRVVRDHLAARPEAWEFVIVDDASTDGTPAILEEFARRHPGNAIRCVRFTENRGKGFATRAGLGIARGAWSVFTDCDLAYPLSNIDRLLQELRAGADAAIACRVLKESTYLISPSFFSYLYTRHLMGRIFNVICRWLTVPRLLDTQAGFKGFRTEVVRPLLGAMVIDGFSFDVELLRALQDNRARIVEIPVSYRYDSEPTTVNFILDSLRMMRDLVHVRARSLFGRYRESARPAARTSGLVVHADDFGLAPGINSAIEEGLEAGTVTSASILMGGPHAAPALAWAAGRPRHDFGVHLNLTQGRPILPAALVPSLVDRRGRFLRLPRFLARYALGRIRPHEVFIEWRAQIRAVRSAGVIISHLDSHQHVHLLPRLFRRVAVRLAAFHRLPLRVMDGPVCRRGIWPDVKGMLLILATLRAVPHDGAAPPAAHGFGTSLMGSPSLRRARRLLSRARPGRTYELVVHPGIPDADLVDSGDAYRQGRDLERRLIASEEFRAVVRNAGFELHHLGPPARPPDRIAASEL